MVFFWWFGIPGFDPKAPSIMTGNPYFPVGGTVRSPGFLEPVRFGENRILSGWESQGFQDARERMRILGGYGGFSTS